MPGANPDASFVAADRALLTPYGLIELRPGAGPRARAAFTTRLATTLANDPVVAVIQWFAAPGYGSIVRAACRLAGVPFLVMAGGAEVASCPAVDFGDARSPWRRRLVRQVLDDARLVWAFSKSAAREIAAVAPAARVRVVPPAVDTRFFLPVSSGRDRLVVTACSAITNVTIRQKGLDRLVALARARPDVPFAIAGRVDADDARVRAFAAEAPDNVRFAGFVTREQLRDLYARAQVYLQLSVHEGFGVAVVEAMAMGCTPLVADLEALRELVPDARLRIREGESLDDQLDRLDAALRRSYAADCWAELDARFGMAARRAAWSTTLPELSASLCADLPPS